MVVVCGREEASRIRRLLCSALALRVVLPVQHERVVFVCTCCHARVVSAPLFGRPTLTAARSGATFGGWTRVTNAWAIDHVISAYVTV